MTTRLPFDKPGSFWKGNLHTHSTRSDGKLTPSEVMAAYQGRGYDFLALTDHLMERFGWPIVDTTAYRTPSFTTLIGAEIHAGTLAHGDRWHLLAVGLPLDFAPPPPEETAPELAARAAAAGAFIGIAHPAWYALTLADALTIGAAHAIEVYNHTSTFHSDRGDSWWLSDQFSTLGRRLLIYGADDAHFSTRPDGFGCWVQVKAPELTPETLLQALKEGCFYTSQGPEIKDVQIADGEIRIACSPASTIFATGRGSTARHIRGAGQTSAAFPLEPFLEGGFFRVTVVAADGTRAWTNPEWGEDGGEGSGTTKAGR